MTDLFLLALVGGITVLVSWSSFRIQKWWRYHRIALSIGFPVFYSPIHISSILWMMLYPICVPVLEKLPLSWTTPWLKLSQVWKIWKLGYEPFEKARSSTFILATPYGNMLWTSDDSIIRDMLLQHPKIDTPVEYVKFFEIWGPTIGSVQGDEWKVHRRAVSAGFGPSINRTVWKETQHQVKTLTAHWMQELGGVVPVIRHWTSRLALHVASSALLGTKMRWNDEVDAKIIPIGHKTTLEKALPLVIEYLSVLFMVPKPLLRWIPGKKFQEAYLGYSETTKYLQELRAGVLNDTELAQTSANKTMLESIVLAGADTQVRGREPLSKESVINDLFFTAFAGHETAGGTLGFIALLMAVYPEYQRRMQKELDDQLDGRRMDQWTVEQDYPILEKGFVGAIQKEVLNLFNPVSFLMRKALEPVTVVDSRGVSHHIPKDNLMIINNAAAARDPMKRNKSSITVERRATLSDSPALYFEPERWLTPTDWTAFGAGGKICPGRVFALVEMTCAMATLFKSHSLELIVPQKVMNECNGNSKLAWEKTRDKVIKMLYDDIEANVSIGLYKEVPIRIVRREN